MARRLRKWVVALALVVPLLGADARQAGGDDYREIRRLWEEARTAARADPAAALPRYDAAIAAAPANSRVLHSGIGAAMRARDAQRLALWLSRYAALGGALDKADRDAAAAILGANADARVLATLAAAETAMGEGTVAATLPPTLHLVEGVSFDAVRRDLYATSVVDRRVERIDARGRRSTVLQLAEGEGYPLGIAFDGRHGALWVAVDASPFGGGSGGGLIRINRGKAQRIGAASGAAVHIGDVAVGPDGTAYGGDSQSGAIYRCPPGCRALSVLVPAGRLRSAQGMAVAPDGRRMWVSDYAYGLLAVDLASGATTRVATGPGVALDMIDGLALRHGRLIAVQNGWTPARVIEIALDAAGTTAAQVHLLARGGLLAEEPTQVAVLGNGDLLLVANSQWSRYERGPDAGRAGQAATRIVRLRDVRPRRSPPKWGRSSPLHARSIPRSAHGIAAGRSPPEG